MKRLTGARRLSSGGSSRHERHPLACPDCGQPPEPARFRRTMALVLAILPLELAVHAAVVQLELPLVLKVLLLTVVATTLAIWVAEPSAARFLRGFLHAPQLRRRAEMDQAQALWRLRFSVSDRAGSLERVTHELAVVGANILAIHVHPLGDTTGAVLDELVVSAPASLVEADLLESLRIAGAHDRAAWPTTPMALADAQTRSLSLAARVAAEPESLPEALSELLGATIHHSGTAVNVSRTGGPDADAAPVHLPPTDAAPGTVLRLPTSSGTPLWAYRPGEPFTPAESARAHRLAELAEAVEASRSRRH